MPGRKCIHELEVNDLCMPCVVIDVSGKAHERYSVTPEDIIFFENQYGVIGRDSCVMIKTGWEIFWSQPERYRNGHVFPSVSGNAARLLVERGVAALGIDTLELLHNLQRS
jgi:kynurenine formamidase